MTKIETIKNELIEICDDALNDAELNSEEKNNIASIRAGIVIKL